MKSRIGATQLTKKLDIRKLKSSEPCVFRGTLLCRSSRLFSFTEILTEKRTMTGDQETGGAPQWVVNFGSRVCFIRFALFRQFKLCFFGLILRKNWQKKRRELGWLWKLLNAKSQKTVKKPQNRQWEVSKLSLRCILEFLE